IRRNPFCLPINPGIQYSVQFRWNQRNEQSVIHPCCSVRALYCVRVRAHAANNRITSPPCSVLSDCCLPPRTSSQLTPSQTEFNDRQLHWDWRTYYVAEVQRSSSFSVYLSARRGGSSQAGKSLDTHREAVLPRCSNRNEKGNVAWSKGGHIDHSY